MISNVSLVSVWVKDIEESKAFYIDVLGFEERDDVVLGDDFRWCTVGHPSQPELHVHLTTPGPPLSPDFAEAITRAQTEGGTFALGISVDDCIATVVDLESKGVEVINQPEERPYGVEALIRDNSGNWIVMVERRDWTPEQIAEFVGDDPSSLNPMANDERNVDRCRNLTARRCSPTSRPSDWNSACGSKGSSRPTGKRRRCARPGACAMSSPTSP